MGPTLNHREDLVDRPKARPRIRSVIVESEIDTVTLSRDLKCVGNDDVCGIGADVQIFNVMRDGKGEDLVGVLRLVRRGTTPADHVGTYVFERADRQVHVGRVVVHFKVRARDLHDVNAEVLDGRVDAVDIELAISLGLYADVECHVRPVSVRDQKVPVVPTQRRVLV